MKNLRQALALFWYFFKIGWFTFGGGWSIVAQMQKDFVEKERTIQEQELLDIVSVGRSLPGTMIGNVAYLFGYHQCGVLGGICSVMGIITPPLVILSVLTLCYQSVRENLYIARALTGVRAVVAPVIFSAVLRLHKGAFPRKLCFCLCGVGCVLSLFWGVSCVLIVLIGVMAGLLMGHSERGQEEC